MAIILNGTTHQLRSLDFGASRPTAYSISGWFKSTLNVSSGLNSIFSMIGSTSARGDLLLFWSSTISTRINRAVIHITGSTYTGTTTQGATTIDVWTHRVAVYTGAQLLFYENGTLVGTAVNATTTAPIPANWFHSIGSTVTFSARLQGKAALQAYYDVALTAEDVKALSKYSPELVRPQNLRSFYPGLRDAKNLIIPGGTVANLTFDDDNPPIIY